MNVRIHFAKVVKVSANLREREGGDPTKNVAYR